jgi:hypothetical protein
MDGMAGYVTATDWGWSDETKREKKKLISKKGKGDGERGKQACPTAAAENADSEETSWAVSVTVETTIERCVPRAST